MKVHTILKMTNTYFINNIWESVLPLATCQNMGAVIRTPPVPLIESRDVSAIQLSHLESGLLAGMYLGPGICFRPLERVSHKISIRNSVLLQDFSLSLRAVFNIKVPYYRSYYTNRRITVSQNHIGWKRPQRTSSPNISYHCQVHH